MTEIVSEICSVFEFNTPGFLSLLNFQENPPSVSNGEGWGGLKIRLSQDKIRYRFSAMED